MSKRVSDIDLMQYLDGELAGEEAREVREALESDAQSQRAARSFSQLGECVRTYAELEADDAEPALARVWERIEGKLQAEGAGGAVAAPQALPDPNKPEAGAWRRFGEWLDGVRGYFVTGALAAAAAAALVIVLSGDERAPGLAATDPAGAPGAPPSPGQPVSTQPAALGSQPPEVESLELYGTSGSVLTIPSEEEDGGGTAVIWLEDKPETEGPI